MAQTNAMRLAMNGPAPLPGSFAANAMRADPQPGDYDGLTSLERQLEGMRDKVRPGQTIRIFDKAGNEFHFLRDDDFEYGFQMVPHGLAPFDPR